MSYFETMWTDPIFEQRERLFGLRSMLNFAGAGASSELTKRVQSISVQNSLYHQISHSLVWELELPFLMCIGKYDGFPWRQNESFKKNVGEVRGCGAVPQDVMRAARKKAKTSVSGKNALEELENLDKGFDRDVERMEFIELYAVTENDAMRDVLQSAEEIDGDFGAFDGWKNGEDVAKELLETSLDEEELRDVLEAKGRMSLNLGLVNYHHLAEFNLTAWDIMEPLNEPIRDFVKESWEHHALFLLDALSTFDFKPNRVRLNNFLAVENVPLDVSEAYLRSFQGFSGRAHAFIEELRVANEEISKIEVGDNDDVELHVGIGERRERYLMLQDSLQIFADRVQGEPESILCVCDCSPTGFLNNPMPIV